MRILVTILFAISFIELNYAQIGINTTNPKATLDIRASNPATPTNTDGILIPRIDTFPLTNPTIEQNGMLVYLTTMVGIHQPGLYYWNHSFGSWVGKTIVQKNHYVGELYGGGIVFYVYDNGNHGLIASLDDLDGGSGVAWIGGDLSVNVGLGARSLFNGASNTSAMVAHDATPNKAGTLCDSFTGGGFTDWYLPAAWELDLLADSLYVIHPILENDGDPNTNSIHYSLSGDSDIYYWTSKELGLFYIANSFEFNFLRGIWGHGKESQHRVRAVRAF